MYSSNHHSASSGKAASLLLTKKQRSCSLGKLFGHVQRGGGTDTLESALLHSAKSQGHRRLLYFCKAAEAEINFLKGEDKERHIAAHTVLLQNAKDTSRRRSAHLNELSNLVLRGAKPSTVENEAKASGLVGEQAKEAVKLTRKVVDGVELAVNLLSSTTESKVHTPMSSRFQPHNTAYVDHMEETIRLLRKREAILEIEAERALQTVRDELTASQNAFMRRRHLLDRMRFIEEAASLGQLNVSGSAGVVPTIAQTKSPVKRKGRGIGRSRKQRETRVSRRKGWCIKLSVRLVSGSASPRPRRNQGACNPICFPAPGRYSYRTPPCPVL